MANELLEAKVREFYRFKMVQVKQTQANTYPLLIIHMILLWAFAAVSSGNLPKILNQVRKAQFQLVMESKASKWPKAMILPVDN